MKIVSPLLMLLALVCGCATPVRDVTHLVYPGAVHELDYTRNMKAAAEARGHAGVLDGFVDPFTSQTVYGLRLSSLAAWRTVIEYYEKQFAAHEWQKTRGILPVEVRDPQEWAAVYAKGQTRLRIYIQSDQNLITNIKGPMPTWIEIEALDPSTLRQHLGPDVTTLPPGAHIPFNQQEYEYNEATETYTIRAFRR